MTDITQKAVERLAARLGGIEVPEHMHGDNLAILLCSFFEYANGEVDDNGWTQAAIAGHDAVLDAIHAHYEPTIRAQAARIAELAAEVARLLKENSLPGDMHWLADDPEEPLECWSTPITDNWDGPSFVYEIMAARSLPTIYVTGHAESLDDEGDSGEFSPVWFATKEEAEGYFDSSVEKLRAALKETPHE